MTRTASNASAASTGRPGPPGAAGLPQAGEDDPDIRTGWSGRD